MVRKDRDGGVTMEGNVGATVARRILVVVVVAVGIVVIIGLVRPTVAIRALHTGIRGSDIRIMVIVVIIDYVCYLLVDLDIVPFRFIRENER